MSIDTAQYTELYRQGQEAVRTAVDAWTHAATGLTGQLPTVASPAEIEAAVDRYFDLGVQLLTAQRDLAKQLVGWGASVGAATLHHAERPAAAAA